MTEINYDPEFLPPPRDPMKPLNVVQPEGASFTMDGNAIAWDRWTLSIGFGPREGIILHDIRDDGRPVVRRAAIAELVVPYGSPERGQYRKNIFDIGEYGFGKFNHSLKLGCDCLGAIHYLDSHYCGLDGGVVTIEKGICIHEDDTGILWKHWDFRADRTELRRGRRLVISCVSTVGSYEYAQYWYLDQAGEIASRSRRPASSTTMACRPGKPSKYVSEVASGLTAPIPQHIFCSPGHGPRRRRQFTGRVNTGPSRWARQPVQQWFYAKETVIETKTGRRKRAPRRIEAGASSAQQTQRRRQAGWLPPAYAGLRERHSSTKPARRHPLNFIRNHVWVTPFAAAERYPAGEYVCNSDGSEGLAEIVKQNRSVENTDLVVWHCFGLHHIVRPEDYPVQPCVSAGFSLMPSGFFSQNPSNDLPRTVNTASVLASGDSSTCHC